MADIATEGLSHALEAERRIEPRSNLRSSWEALLADARQCTRCDLYKPATQTVFGEGPLDAAIMFVGEQPGDQEDLAGRPFVGPAGALFDAALEAAGIDRSTVYVTNAVKHFKFVQRGKRRIHNKPDSGEIKIGPTDLRGLAGCQIDLRQSNDEARRRRLANDRLVSTFARLDIDRIERPSR